MDKTIGGCGANIVLKVFVAWLVVCFCSILRIAKEFECIVNGFYSHELDATVDISSFKVAVGNYCSCKTKSGSLFNTLLEVGNGAHLSRKAKLTDCDKLVGDYFITERGDECHCDGKVTCRLVDTKAADDVDIGIVCGKTHIETLFKYRKNEVETVIVNSV